MVLKLNVSYGWVCPLCDTVYAPFVTQCLKHGSYVSSTATSSGIIRYMNNELSNNQEDKK